MKRREAIEKMGFSFIGILSAPAVLGLLQSCQDEKGQLVIRNALLLLNPSQEKLVNELADVILPQTSSPGAGQAEIGKFIDLMMAECYYEQDQALFIEGLDRVAQASLERYKKTFTTASSEEKTNLLKLEASPQGSEEPTRFFQLLKELTLLGYFTSEVGATQALAYKPYPGKYVGCIELKEDQKLWAAL